MNHSPEDELLRLRRELAEAEATIASLRRENAALGASLDTAAPGGAAPALPPAAPVAGAASDTAAPVAGPAYRSPDPTVEAEAALSEALATVADLRIENAILHSRAAARVPWRAAAIGLAALAGVLGVMGFFWLVSKSAGLILFAAVMLVIGAAMVHLIGGIPPRGGDPPPGPPLVPGG